MTPKERAQLALKKKQSSTKGSEKTPSNSEANTTSDKKTPSF